MILFCLLFWSIENFIVCSKKSIDSRWVDWTPVCDVKAGILAVVWGFVSKKKMVPIPETRWAFNQTHALAIEAPHPIFLFIWYPTGEDWSKKS